MNCLLFITLLNRLTDDDWQAIFNGAGLVLVNDQQLISSSASTDKLIINGQDFNCSDIDQLKQAILSSAENLLTHYYQIHPLTETGFRKQVERLIQQHGAAAFSARPGEHPEYSLFVEGGEVIAEDSQSPRHPYGVFCELEAVRLNSDVESQVHNWLTRGEGYQQYLAMNVCRYNC